MNAENIKNTIEEFCPPCLAEEWDNSGMQIEIPDKAVKKVLVALEVSELVIDQAHLA